MLPMIDKEPEENLLKELTADIFVRPTNNIGNHIYIFDGNEKPALMREVGRLREWSFREAGGGSGKPTDIDEYDEGDKPYKQLIVWNPEDNEIVGGYRFQICEDARRENGTFHLSTTEIFEFSDTLKNLYFPYTIELGRSFVQPQYQPSSENRKGLFSLDNLWDGLGALVVIYPHIRYFFGKVTMYTHFNRTARDLILCFMHHYFPDKENLVNVPNPVISETDCNVFLAEISGLEYKDGHRLLNQKVRELGENIPPLFNSYMNLSPSMRTFGTAVNHHFGDVEETGIMVSIEDIYPSKKDRHIKSYLDYISGAMDASE
ncbi:MAG: GNAT family N-acetyltransferase [Bacteroidetes bacterium]|nr:GNAT family N-acetyltransferase [Bacteroidota bacterium]